MPIDENHLARMVREARDATLDQNKRIDALTAGVGLMNERLMPFELERNQILRAVNEHEVKIGVIEGRLTVVENKVDRPLTVVMPQPSPAVPTAETTARDRARRYPTAGLAGRLVAATSATRVKLALLVVGMMLGTAMIAVLASVLIINRG